MKIPLFLPLFLSMRYHLVLTINSSCYTPLRSTSVDSGYVEAWVAQSQCVTQAVTRTCVFCFFNFYACPFWAYDTLFKYLISTHGPIRRVRPSTMTLGLPKLYAT